MHRINIHCVGMRDGLQMEKTVVPTDVKIQWVEGLYKANPDIVQIGSFVHKERMPQMADTDELFIELNKRGTKPEGVTLSGLVLNEKGLERAMNCGVGMVCIGASASETHSMKNTGKTVEDAVSRLIKMAQEVEKTNIKLQVSVQSAFGCGFEGDINENKIYGIVDRYLNAGIKLISLADTAGYANPSQVERIYNKVFSMAPDDVEFACHFHNTFGMGLANCYAAYKAGVQYFEAAFGGLGGCPFTKKASGNVPTEDLVEMFQNMGRIKHINIDALNDVAKSISEYFGRELPGYVYKTGSIKH